MIGFRSDRARAQAAEVLLYGKPGCHLCDDARAAIDRVCTPLGVPWREISIASDPELTARYGEMIPVIEIDGVVHDYFRVDERRLCAALG